MIHNKDARKLDEMLSEQSVDVTITSPPYFDLKDYGHKEQIGYGQEYAAYLNDLKIVFEKVYKCTKITGTLWVIIDSFRRKNEVIPLPFDFSNKLKEVGWKLQEVIVWQKDRTVPWAHQGQMRNLFEYILLFSKENNYNFYIDEVRDFQSLKKWWVKYPERYNPKGKTPDGIWKFDIPVQGSWGKGYIKHFCPLPEEMIAQILKISTRPGDIVLDPFAGSGAVLAKAHTMKRRFVGFELNKSYIGMFRKYLVETSAKKSELYTKQQKTKISQTDFNKLILDLRALKFPKMLLKKIAVNSGNSIIRILVDKKGQATTQKNALTKIGYTILVKENTNIERLLKAITKAISLPPLSKFGIEAEIKIELKTTLFYSRLNKMKKLYSYTRNVTHRYHQEISGNKVADISKSEVIISSIKVELNENDYE